MNKKEFWEKHYAIFKTLTDKKAIGEATYNLHREYYAQFVSQYTKQVVLNSFPIERLTKSNDRYFNFIPLAEWDRLIGWDGKGINIWRSGSAPKHLGIKYHEMAAAEGSRGVSSCMVMCVAKEAAMQIVEEYKASIK